MNKFVSFVDLLISFNPYFYMDENIYKSDTVEPSLLFISKSDGQRFEFTIPRTDIYNYSNGKDVGSINNMVLTLMSFIRDKKIGEVLDDNIQ